MNIPKHVGIICDGNRRFAKALGEVVWKGHEHGANKVEEVLEWCQDLGIKTLTLWLFSTENFNRPAEEKEQLFRIAKELANRVLNSPKIHGNKVKINIVGNLSLFPEDVQAEARKVLEATKNYDNYVLNIVAGYGGKQEIVEATKQIAKLVVAGKLKPEEITKEVLDANMYSSLVPGVDLVIRTSGEQRTSGFLLWKTDYSEFYFSDKYWPEFSKEDLIKALVSYAERKRRYGE